MSKIVIAKLNIRQGEADNFLTLAQEIIAQTRKEAGCISYSLYKECFGEQSEFIFFEEYKDEDALLIHNNSEYLKAFLEGITPVLSCKPSIKVI